MTLARRRQLVEVEDVLPGPVVVVDRLDPAGRARILAREFELGKASGKPTVSVDR